MRLCYSVYCSTGCVLRCFVWFACAVVCLVAMCCCSFVLVCVGLVCLYSFPFFSYVFVLLCVYFDLRCFVVCLFGCVFVLCCFVLLCVCFVVCLFCNGVALLF